MLSVELTSAGIARSILDGICKIIDRNIANGHRGRIGLDSHR